jgi:hypothetical protein
LFGDHGRFKFHADLVLIVPLVVGSPSKAQPFRNRFKTGLKPVSLQTNAIVSLM